MRPRPKSGVVAQTAHDTTVLLRMNDGAYFSLDEVGVEVWQRCDGTRTLEMIAVDVGELFDAPESVVHADVTAFVHEMADEGLLEDAG